MAVAPTMGVTLRCRVQDVVCSRLRDSLPSFPPPTPICLRSQPLLILHDAVHALMLPVFESCFVASHRRMDGITIDVACV